MMMGKGLLSYTAQKIVLRSSIFPNKIFHKAVLALPDQSTNNQNQIDHMCISRNFCICLMDCRLKRGTDAALDYQYHLVKSKIELKSRMTSREQTGRTKYNVNTQKEEITKAKFELTLSNMFQILQEMVKEEDMSVHTLWEKTKEAIHTTYKKEIGSPKTLKGMNQGGNNMRDRS